jgi:FtsP/CotA-like multicopper oxidase with cupredoxin domain
MSGGRRAVVIIVGAVVAVGAFLLLRPGDDKNSNKTSTTTKTPTLAPVKKIQIKGGKAEGGLAEISAHKGDTVRFQVSTDKNYEIHLHGYNVAKNATTTTPASFQLKATETGIFEIEIEDTGTQIAELKVEP